MSSQGVRSSDASEVEANSYPRSMIQENLMGSNVSNPSDELLLTSASEVPANTDGVLSAANETSCTNYEMFSEPKRGDKDYEIQDLEEKITSTNVESVITTFTVKVYCDLNQLFLTFLRKFLQFLVIVTLAY